MDSEDVFQPTQDFDCLEPAQPGGLTDDDPQCWGWLVKPNFYSVNLTGDSFPLGRHQKHCSLHPLALREREELRTLHVSTETEA